MPAPRKKQYSALGKQYARKKSCCRQRRVEEELCPFFALSLDLLCIASMEGYFKRLNPEWERSLGWTVEELQARPFLDFVHADDRESTVGEMRSLAGGDITINFENRYLCKDGTYRWLQWVAQSLTGAQLIYASARDVTDRKRLEKEILDSADREKVRIGQELHDGLCQNLAGVAALSATLSRKLSADSHRAAADATQITKLLNESIGYARELAHGLDPVGLSQIGLAATLELFAANVRSFFQVDCAFECDYPALTLEPAVEMHLYRIIQEAVNNAVTHGRAKRIGISLFLSETKGYLRVHDNGAGISKTALAQASLGHSMVYRSHLIGAHLHLKEAACGGTTVICEFPLSPGPSKDSCDAREAP